MMAGAGIAIPGHISYADLCGLYYLRHDISRAHRRELASAFSQAIRTILP